jgi:uncharacterized LabA/DUF88 family protein
MQLVPRPSRPNQPATPNPLDPLSEIASFRSGSKPAAFSYPDQGFSPTANAERVIVFIDGANLFYAAMQLELEIDYTKLLRCLTEGRSLIRAYFYTGVDRTNEKQQGFLLWMRRNGYRVVSKDLIQFPDGSKKANLDVEIAVDMLSLCHYCDTMILLSGTGELSYVVNSVAYKGTRVEVVSLPSMTSESLLSVADQFVDLTTLKPSIQKGATFRSKSA